MLFHRRVRRDSTWLRNKFWESCYPLNQHVGMKKRLDHFQIVTVQLLKYDLTILAMTIHQCLSLCLALYPPGALIVLMQAWISMSAQLAVILSHEIQGFRGQLGEGWPTISFLPPFLSTHPEQTGPGPCPGLNPFHQSDLREKHSSIPEKTSHIYRSSGNRRRLMKCRPEPQRKRELQYGTNLTPK